jgi:hypothetical protein
LTRRVLAVLHHSTPDYWGSFKGFDLYILGVSK